MSEPPIVTGDQPSPQAAQRTFEDSRARTAGRLLNNRPAIFLLLFCVTGFLGLPLLWKSNAFSTKEKVVWSVINTLYTCILIGLTAAIVWWSYSNIRATLG
jgi:hypothetical protein